MRGKQIVYEMLANGECKLVREIVAATGYSERSIRRFVRDLRYEGHRIAGSRGAGGGLMLRKEKANVEA